MKKFVTWNVNGIRACVKKGFEESFAALDADIFALQETKMQEGQLDLDLPGYHQYWNYAEKKGYSGTAVFAKEEPLSVTFGMGARAQAIVGTNLYNRSSMVEGRALLKVRTGDTEAEAENALGAVPGAMGSVKAAELGTIGAELGVGITVPMGSDGGSIFADASLEVSSGYTNINGTVGYRINF